MTGARPRPWSASTITLLVTVALFCATYSAGVIAFDGFLSLQVFLNLLVDNAFVAISAVGMTFVILSGGIDLSVGSVMGLTTMVTASLIQDHGWSPAPAIAIALALGAAIGLVMGFVIVFFRVQPFVVTLAGMFLARGICYLIGIDSIGVDNELLTEVSVLRIPVGLDSSITVNAIAALVMVAVALYIGHFTRFGRTVYAIGGNEQSALLMGLPVARTKVLIYTFNGFCSALAGTAMMLYMMSGNPNHAQGMELDVIAAVVIGGTLLNGGSGYVVGTLLGVLLGGTIQSLIAFDGTLSSWWTKIFIGLLLLAFCLLQRLFERRNRRVA
ncbi:MAG TPA: galactofuranose ABC transporter, permease protein YjfF [Kofleriaceae bacterium]|nr:galactofuranose ABC transporter, permease protein YjfF [Kofleriaceae bacterium]